MVLGWDDDGAGPSTVWDSVCRDRVPFGVDSTCLSPRTLLYEIRPDLGSFPHRSLPRSSSPLQTRTMIPTPTSRGDSPRKVRLRPSGPRPHGSSRPLPTSNAPTSPSPVYPFFSGDTSLTPPETYVPSLQVWSRVPTVPR